MKKSVLIFCFSFLFTCSFAQTGEPIPVQEPEPKAIELLPEEIIYQVADQDATFPGGNSELMKWIAAHLKYPQFCLENEIQGKVFVSFVIEKDGSMSNFKIRKSVHDLLDKEALRVLKSMPKWVPGQINGKKIRQEMTLPIAFRLN